jgi:hypothetical protein
MPDLFRRFLTPTWYRRLAALLSSGIIRWPHFWLDLQALYLEVHERWQVNDGDRRSILLAHRQLFALRLRTPREQQVIGLHKSIARYYDQRSLWNFSSCHLHLAGEVSRLWRHFSASHRPGGNEDETRSGRDDGGVVAVQQPRPVDASPPTNGGPPQQAVFSTRFDNV